MREVLLAAVLLGSAACNCDAGGGGTGGGSGGGDTASGGGTAAGGGAASGGGAAAGGGGPAADGGAAVALVSGLAVASPRVALGDDGTALAVWLQGTPAGQLWASRHGPAATSGWATPARLDESGSARFPLVALDGQGDGWVAWNEATGGVARRFTAATGALGAAAPVVAGRPLVGLAIDRGGTATAFVVQGDGFNVDLVLSAVRSAAGGAWGSPAELLRLSPSSIEPSITALAASASAAGDLLVTYTITYATGSPGGGLAQYQADAGRWDLVGPALSGNPFSPGLDAAGVGYVRTTTGSLQRRPALDAGWAPVPGAPPTDLTGALGVFPAGDVLFLNRTQAGALVATRLATPADTWGAPLSLSPNSAIDGLVRTGADGDAVVAWTRRALPQSFVRVAVFRAAGQAWLPNDYLSRFPPAVEVSVLSDLAMNASGQVAGVGTEAGDTAVWASWVDR